MDSLSDLSICDVTQNLPGPYCAHWGIPWTPVTTTCSGLVHGGVPSHAPGTRGSLRDGGGGGVVHEAGAADVRGLWASGVGNGGHDLPGYTDADWPSHPLGRWAPARLSGRCRGSAWRHAGGSWSGGRRIHFAGPMTSDRMRIDSGRTRFRSGSASIVKATRSWGVCWRNSWPSKAKAYSAPRPSSLARAIAVPARDRGQSPPEAGFGGHSD